MKAIFNNIITKVERFSDDSNPDGIELMTYVCKVIHKELDTYDWVGFYLVSTTEDKMLELGPYVGEETDHLKIPFGKGICGQTAESQETFIIDDVSKESNYIACSIHVKSEIVVPMFQDDKMIGQIDIDSSTPSAFTEEDEVFLKKICTIVSPFIKTT
jgi:GAF domain-containing protein